MSDMECFFLNPGGSQRLPSTNVYFRLRTTPTFIKSLARNTIKITPTIIISPRSNNFFRDICSELLKLGGFKGSVLKFACFGTTLGKAHLASLRD